MLQNGQILNNTYTLIERIGSGGGGIIYKAYHERLKKYVVVKEIRDCVQGVLDGRAEADILKNLNHTYLPQVFDFLEIDGKIFTILDFIPGVSLEQALQKSEKFSQKDVLKWLRQLAEALAYLHNQKPPVIHSDIKPANIMLTPEGNICLIDFNVSLALGMDKRTSTGITCGYSPPEQYWNYEMYCDVTGSVYRSDQEKDHQTKLIEEAEKQKRSLDKNDTGFSRQTQHVTHLIGKGVDERSDIFSLGATVYHLLTGVPPANACENLVPISTYNLSISKGFTALIEKMMQIEPEKRYQNGSELLEALQHLYELDEVYKRYRNKKMLGTLTISSLCLISILLITTGIKTLEKEKRSRYYLEIETVNQAIEAAKYEEAFSLLQQLQEQMPQRIEAYEKQIEALYNMEDYDNCIQTAREIINQAPFAIKTASDRIHMGNLYYLLGNAYYEKEDFSNANICFSLSLQYDEKNIYCYRDYSISLAKSGNQELAAEKLKQAVSLGMGEDSLYLAQGELAFLNQSYQKALQLFQTTLNRTEDLQIQKRCVLLADRVYQALGDSALEEEIQFLEYWNTMLFGQGSRQITERLIHAYVRHEDWELALEQYQRLDQQGYLTYQSLSNQAILYQQIGDLEEAERIFQRLEQEYGERYETYMRFAFLEADRQQKKQNEERNYHQMKHYYEKARELYSKQEKQDSEMQVLDSMFADVKEGGWLD